MLEPLADEADKTREVDIFDSLEYACLNNFAEGYGFWVDGDIRCRRKWWPTAEHYFQAGKFIDEGHQESIRRATEAGVAKALGRTLQPLRADWEDVKRSRIRDAMLLKLRSHSKPREMLLDIPSGARIVNGNPADPYFGTGSDGNGSNVIGQVLEELRDLFSRFPQRRCIKLNVADLGEPCEPFYVDLDVTAVSPRDLVQLVACALRIRVAAISGVELVTDGGFEKTPLESFSSAVDLDEFLEKNKEDCVIQARLDEPAIVTLWDGVRDQFLSRSDLRYLCPSLEALTERMTLLMPSMAYAGFSYTFSVMINGDEDSKFRLDASSLQLVVNDAVNGEDVVVSVSITQPSALLSPLLMPPEGELGPASISEDGRTMLDMASLADRIKGMIWGAALGDAVGLSTEFMKASEAVDKYPDPMKLSPAARFEDRHRSRWSQGDWTDDTDQFVLLMDAIVSGGGVLDQRHFARSLKQWQQQGFPELGDRSGLGIGQTVNSVLEHPLYDNTPDLAADSVWRESGCTMAANGAIMRAAASSLGYFWDETVVRYNAVAGAMVTHADPRCKASCVAIVYVLSRLFQGVSSDTIERRRGELSSALQVGGEELDGGDADELWRHMMIESDGLPGLELGTGGIGYTYKPLGAACWAYTHCENFRDAICAIVMQAGDADSNATVAGALLGARLGYQKLPRDWLQEIPDLQRNWMEQKVKGCFHMLGLVH